MKRTSAASAIGGENGFVFYVEPVTIGSTGLLGTPNAGRDAAAGPVDEHGGMTNVKSLTFTEDCLAAASVKSSFIESFTRTVIPLPAVPPLRVPRWQACLHRRAGSRSCGIRQIKEPRLPRGR